MNDIKLNNRPYPWKEGLTIQAIMNTENFTFKMLVVKINGALIKKDQYSKAIVPQGADVKIIHLISGG